MAMDEEMELLRRRFFSLAAEAEDDIPGAADISTGLEKIVSYLGDREVSDPQRLRLIVQGLSGLADFLESDGQEAVESPSQTGDSTPMGLKQFVETFRKEAEKRIQGLSISLMGIFGKDGSEAALEQSTDHLHAIRGGAAMLGIKGVAELTATMEETLIAHAKIDPKSRDWPTKTLLRGYALLEDAVQSEPLCVSAEEAQEVVGELRSGLSYLKEPSSQNAPSSPEEQISEADVSRETPSSPIRDRDDKVLEQPILIVDDIETIAASVAFILAELEVPIELASHGEEAMQMLNDKPFSLVISDVDMPRMDGIAMTRMIRSTDEFSHLPVILLTSLDHPEERQAGMEAGATDYLIKGAIGGGELLNRVRDLLEVAPVVERRERPEMSRILVAEDTETVAASIAFVLSEGPFDIIIATDGQDAMRKLQKSSFDLLITDMQMPYMSGTELVQSVRSTGPLAHLPVLMLTSVQDDEMVAEAVDAGVDRYLIKGEIAGGKLLSIVEEMLHPEVDPDQ